MNTLQICTFQVGDLLLGLDVAHTQEVIRHHSLTPVPLAHPVVAGLLNLRGEIVTALDVRRRLDLEGSVDGDPTHVVVTAPAGTVSLLVDTIGDVIEIPADVCEPPPPNLPGPLAEVLSQVAKLDQGLLLLVDIARFLQLPAHP